MTSRILVVEDEADIASYIRRGLTAEGFWVDVADDGMAALAAAREHLPDLIVLDLMLPGIDGIEVTRRLRTVSDVPIIMLTARDAIADRVAGLGSGADDYMPKPFAFAELVARVRVQLRRRQAQQSGEIVQRGPLRMDIAAHELRMHSRVVELTAKEFEILELFLRHANQVLTREIMYDRIWGYDFGADSNVIEVYISGLRQKLEAAGEARLIHTVRGVGYVLRDEST